MKLNLDCVRDVLLYLEEQLTINCKSNAFEFITLHKLTEGMLRKNNTKYTEEDIWYIV